MRNCLFNKWIGPNINIQTKHHQPSLMGVHNGSIVPSTVMWNKRNMQITKLMRTIIDHEIPMRYTAEGDIGLTKRAGLN
jgi:hypothetical protein